MPSNTCPTIEGGNRCGKAAEPGFVVCAEHVPGPALLLAYQNVRRDLTVARREIERLRALVELAAQGFDRMGQPLTGEHFRLSATMNAEGADHA